MKAIWISSTPDKSRTIALKTIQQSQWSSMIKATLNGLTTPPKIFIMSYGALQKRWKRRGFFIPLIMPVIRKLQSDCAIWMILTTRVRLWRTSLRRWRRAESFYLLRKPPTNQESPRKMWRKIGILFVYQTSSWSPSFISGWLYNSKSPRQQSYPTTFTSLQKNSIPDCSCLQWASRLRTRRSMMQSRVGFLFRC